jgi:hypothetical protein
MVNCAAEAQRGYRAEAKCRREPAAKLVGHRGLNNRVVVCQIYGRKRSVRVAGTPPSVQQGQCVVAFFCYNVENCDGGNMKAPLNTWPNTTSSKGTLFFAQAMSAFLNDDSFEGFRAYSLDTLTRLRETYAVAEDIKLKRIKKPALRPVIDELLWSLENDSAARSLALEEIAHLNRAVAPGIPEADQLQLLIRMLINKIEPDYHEALRDQVVEAVAASNRRIQLLQSTGFLVSHLLNSGHSKIFLLRRAEEKFFTNDIGRAGAAVVKAFIDGISQEKRRYCVVCAISRETANILQLVENFQIVRLPDLPPHAQAEIAAWPSYRATDRYVLETVTAADRHRAVSYLHDRLVSTRALMILQPQRTEVDWSEQFYAFSPRGTTGETTERSETSLQSVNSVPISGRRLKQMTRIPRQIERDFDEMSKERLFSAVSTAAVALDTNLAETRLITLWSAFEVLLSDPPEGDARIVHYVKNLTPCISIKYHRRLFAAVHDQLVVNYRKRFRRILDRVDTCGFPNQHTKFANLIVLPEYEAERSALLSLCDDSPLALHRLFRLRKFYGNPKASFDTITEHSNRVSWQLHRIYRARNNLVHAGSSPLFLDSLVLNSLEYFRSAVQTIARKARSRDTVQQIDQVVAEIGFDWHMKMALLGEYKGETPFTSDLALRVFGPG